MTKREGLIFLGRAMLVDLDGKLEKLWNTYRYFSQEGKPLGDVKIDHKGFVELKINKLNIAELSDLTTSAGAEACKIRNDAKTLQEKKNEPNAKTGL